MRQSLTDMLQYKQYYADAALLCLRREVPEAVARNTKFYLDPKVDDMSWVASMASTFAKRLVKSEEVLRKRTGDKTSSITFYIPPYPKRTIDYLIKYVAAYIPWFNRFYQEQHDKVTTPVTVEQYDITVKEHYHLLPMEGNGHEMRYYLMSWDGEYYDGSPTEWNDLKAIRDFLDKEGIKVGDLNWGSKLWNLFVTAENNRKSMNLVSDRYKFNG